MSLIAPPSADEPHEPRPVPVRQRPADPRLWRAAGDFEAVFLTQFVKALRTSSIRNDLFQKAPGRETFDAMFSEAIASQMAESGSLGLRSLIYRDMGGKYEPLPPAAGAGPSNGEER